MDKIKDIENAIAEMKHTKKSYASDINFNLAIRALNKQLPKKMEYYELGNYYRCHNCKGRYDNPQEDGILYCAICGQRIDWNDID